MNGNWKTTQLTENTIEVFSLPYSKSILIKQDEKSLTVKKIDNLLTNKITWKGN